MTVSKTANSSLPFSSVAESVSSRPCRQKKSYQELYPSLFKNRRKRSADGAATAKRTERIIRRRGKDAPAAELCPESSSLPSGNY